MLARLRALQPVRGDVSDLRQQAEEVLRDAGFHVTRDYRIRDRGDGRAGFVDLFAALPGAAGPIAIEVDGAVMRERTLTKLRGFARSEGAYCVVLLRTAAKDAPKPGIHAVVGMGWPGNGAADRAEEAMARAEAAKAKLRVGMAGALGRAAAAQHVDPSAATVRAVFAAVGAQMVEFGGFGSALHEEWDAAMGAVTYERHEMTEAGALLLVVSSPDPPGTLRALAQYETRIAREMAETFGREVQVQVEGEEAGDRE